MNDVWLYALVSVGLVSLIALVGVILLPVNQRKFATLTKYLIGLSAGAMLGNVVSHLLPESYEHSDSALTTTLFIVGGFLACFVFDRVLRLRCHHSIDRDACGGCCNRQPDRACCKESPDGHAHHDHDKAPGAEHIHPTGWLSIMSHSIENFTDGVVIAASYMISIEVGIATTIAVILHEIPLELGEFGVLLQAGFQRKRALLINFLSGLIAFIGTALVLWLGSSLESAAEAVTPVAAGMMLYITCMGLLPKLWKESSRKVQLGQFAVFACCFVLMLFIGGHGDGHAHSPQPGGQTAPHQDHNHGGHKHHHHHHDHDRGHSHKH